MFQFLVLGVLAGLFVQVESQGGFSCNITLRTACQNGFQALTNIDLRLPWQQVRFAIENSYAGQNDSNFRLVCRGFYEFGNCMRENYYRCYNIPWMVQNDSLPLQDVYNYLSVFFQSHFACGAGFGVFIANEGCFLQAWQNSRNTMDICLNRFYEQVAANLGSPSAPFCALGNELRNCYELVFDSACSGLIDSLWWGCEYARTAVITQFPFCSTADYRCVQRAPIPPS